MTIRILNASKEHRDDTKQVLATKQWSEEKEKDKYKRKTSQRIVEEINEAQGTNVNESTVRRYVASGHIGVPCIGQGRKCVMPESIMKEVIELH